MSAAAVAAVPKAKDAPARAEPKAMDAEGPAAPQEDLYTKLKTLQRQLEFLEIQVRPGRAWAALQGSRRNGGARALAAAGPASAEGVRASPIGRSERAAPAGSRAGRLEPLPVSAAPHPTAAALLVLPPSINRRRRSTSRRSRRT